MSRKDLKNKPLVEAILEVRWRLMPQAAEQSQGAGQPGLPGVDPHHKLLLGRLFDRFQKQYPEHEQLATARLPDELAGHMVQHRFRTASNDWPLVQVGPGILTVNDTSKYTWVDFSGRANRAIESLFDAHPKLADLTIQSLVLRYIDAVEFDYGKNNAFDFLREQLKIQTSLPPSLFADTGVNELPASSQWQASFACSKPRGRVHISFATGQKNEKPVIVWETTVESSNSDVPSMPGGFPAWIDAAHDITDNWFFKLIEGELERRFEGE